MGAQRTGLHKTSNNTNNTNTPNRTSENVGKRKPILDIQTVLDVLLP